MRKLLLSVGAWAGLLLVLFVPWVGWQAGGLGYLLWLVLLLVGIPLIAHFDRIFYSYRKKGEENATDGDDANRP